MNLTDAQVRMALYAVGDLIANRHLGGRSVPPGFYRFREQLDASVRGSENDVRQEQSMDEDLIDTAAAAVILKCSRRWVRQIRNDLDGRNYGGCWVFRRKSVLEYAEMRGREHTPD